MDILDVILLKEIIQNNSIFFEINIDISQDGSLNILDLILLIQLILDNG